MVISAGADAVGPAGPIIVGDEVIDYRIIGAYAEEIVVAAENVVPKPPKLSRAQAATMMLSGTTAVHALAAVRVRPGQTVLVHGAGVGVGLAIVQLARLDGIDVVGTLGLQRFDKLRRYGASTVAHGEGLL